MENEMDETRIQMALDALIDKCEIERDKFFKTFKISEGGKSAKVFISYAREDIETARKLHYDLRKAGLAPWMDKIDLIPGQKWKPLITSAIQESQYFLALLSSNSVSKKGYVQKELKIAMEILDQYPAADDIFIIPARLNDCKPLDETLQGLHWADLFPDYEEGLEDILRAFSGCRAVISGGREPPVYRKADEPAESSTVKEESKTVKDRERITNSIGMEFVLIHPGTFMMGSPEDEPGRFDNKVLHQVTLTRSFYMQTTQVTVEQWRVFAQTGFKTEAETGDGAYGWTGSKWKKDKKCYWDNPGFAQADTQPVTCVSWNDAKAFIKWLNQKEGAIYRLPTEAEWEYSCRAGTYTPFFFGGCLSTDQANYNGNYPLEGCSKGEYRKKTTPVASFEPNVWGPYDMHGNVWEWCQDYYASYPSPAVTDPVNEKGSSRVLRGGSWGDDARNCRSAQRLWNVPGNRNGLLGVRLVRSYHFLPL